MSPKKRMATASVYLKYFDLKTVAELKLKDRREFIRNFFKANFRKLLNTNCFTEYELIGTTRKPLGIKTTVSLATLNKLAAFSYVKSIVIRKLDGAKKKPGRTIDQFYCVKMTVAIQIEGFISGLQTIEDRYVLVKAKSEEAAYNQVARQEKKYSKPYFNSDLRLVRWKIESYDDCFCTSISEYKEIVNPKGVEVFSVLRNRKLTKARSWSGDLS